MTLTHKTIHVDYYHGQHNFTLQFFQDDVLVGWVDYSTYGEEIYIQMIKVKTQFRRSGIGKTMLRTLQQEYPNQEISLGSLTDSGEKLIQAMPVKMIPNGNVGNLQQELEQVRKDIVIANDTKNYDIMHDLYDRERELEDEIDNRSPTKRIFENEIQNIVWKNAQYYIRVDDLEDARYISAWTVGGKKIGELATRRLMVPESNGYLNISYVEVAKAHRRNGLAYQMYRAILEYAAPSVKGICSYLPDVADRNKIPAIWKRLGGFTHPTNEDLILVNRPTI